MNNSIKFTFVVSLFLCSQSFANTDKDFSQHANKLLDYAMSTELANAEIQATQAKLKAKKVREQLNSTVSHNAIERNAHLATSGPSPIETVKLKSLVTTSGTTTAWIDLDGEMIEVNEGSQVGALTIISIHEDSIVFSDGKQKKRRWMAGATPPKNKELKQ